MNTLAVPSVDLTACDREPITRLERVQAFGFLLAMSSDWVVRRASENTAQLLGIAPSAAIGAKVDTLLDRQALHDIRNRMLSLYLTRGTERLFGIALVKNRNLFDVSVHQAGEFFILEGEPSIDATATDAALLVRRAMSRLATRATLESFHTDAARQIRAITGFDRVMIYRFDDSGDGEVIAEALSASMESYLGLHYPASDIPAQARELYLKNPFRIIADVNAPSIEVLNTEARAVPLDLTLSVTRAVSPIHIEYLQNMGVGASMSISIIADRKLWGLIACHHGTAKLPSFVIRTSAELFGHMYSLSLESRLREQSAKQQERLTQATRQILDGVVGDDALLARAEWLQEVVRDVIGGQGTAIVFRGAVSVAGDAPNLDVIEDIVTKLKSSASSMVTCTDQLAVFVPSAAGCTDVAAGMMAIPISSSPRDYLILFRREVLREVRWAGNPRKPVHSDPDARISPRKSFAVFEDKVVGRSLRFTAWERQSAEVIRSALIEVVLKVSESADDARRRASERQEILIAELNHRVRNVLALMRGLVSQSSTEATSVEAYVASINGRIQALARAHDRVTKRNWAPARLSSLLDDEIAAYVPTERERFMVVGAPVFLHPKAFSTMALVIHELVTNSRKYGALSTDGRVAIDINLIPDSGLHFKWRERGGPPVKPPARRGFGSVIIERTVPFDLQGTATVEYAPAGFEAAFFIPQVHIAELTQSFKDDDGDESDVTRLLPGKEDRPLEGFELLLLEDNFIVSLEAEDILKSLGAKQVHVAPTVAAAMQIIEREKLHFAMLDINLGLETSDAVAERLGQLGVPFVFASGYDETATPQGTREPRSLVTKPFDLQLVRAAVAHTIGRSV
jgi:light-regulated signal transduction histidine kinase (bacteriophytochrome)